MSDAKTKPTDASVADFINAVENKRRREDALVEQTNELNLQCAILKFLDHLAYRKPL